MRRICPNCQTATYDDSKRVCYACLQEFGTSQSLPSHEPYILEVPPVSEPLGTSAAGPVKRGAHDADILRYEALLQAERAARVELEDKLRRCERTLALRETKPDTPAPQVTELDERATAGSTVHVNRLLAGALVLAFATIVVQAALPHFFEGEPKAAALLSVAAQHDCPVRTDPAGAEHADTTLWIYEGRKATDLSDALDADRSITAACVARMGSEVTLQKATRVWSGSDPGLQGGLVATERVLPAGATVRISGALSGLSVSNGDGTFLHYEVWAPIALR